MSIQLVVRSAVVSGAAVAALAVAPAASSAPPNNKLGDAQPITSLPATVAGTTQGATLAEAEPAPSCAPARGNVWYTVDAPHRGPMVARLKAGGKLDGAIAVYRVLRSRRTELACQRTDTHGRAVVSWYGYTEGSYLVSVAQRRNSIAGTFDLSVLAAERPPHPPGAALPPNGIRTTIDPILDASDAWSLRMERGTSYRINLTSPSECVSLSLYRPGVYSFARARPVQSYPCGGYAVFTPGIDGGGVYSLVVRARGDVPAKISYRLQAGVSGLDDVAPGIRLTNGKPVAGRIFGKGIDAVDLYRLIVPRPNELTTLGLQQKPNVGLDLLVISETGEKMACACEGKGRQVLREHLAPGRYYVVVRSRAKSGGKYGLLAQIRDVTTTTISSGGSSFVEAPPSAPVPIQVAVTSPNKGGPVKIEIDRFDPLSGWHFARVIDTRVDSTGLLTQSWVPPSVGHWRARARFVGTPFSNYSESGYVRVHVAEPLE